ncbi:MAG: DUF1294 domain-containing protein [Oscillospiraceae bacterium]
MQFFFAVLLALCLICSLICFVLCGFDKRASKRRGDRRVPERRFFTLALMGGGAGLWLGMRVFHHKTRHTSFRVIAPLTTCLWLGCLGWVSYRAFF